MTDANDPWPFPSVSLQRMRNAAGERVWGLFGLDPRGIESYLSRFGVIPAIDEPTGARKVVRWGPDGEWAVTDPCGTTPLENPPERIGDIDEARRCLISHAWYSIGFTVNPALTEFTFSPNGEGFSRHLTSGFGSKIPSVLDVYWRYTMGDGTLHVEWEDAPATDIGFALCRQLRAASSHRDGSLAFYEATLTVDRHLFPPGSRFEEGWPKEYWGRQNAAATGGSS
jgi:hypothetical protein